jgi:hypothetical protein
MLPIQEVKSLLVSFLEGLGLRLKLVKIEGGEVLQGMIKLCVCVVLVVMACLITWLFSCVLILTGIKMFFGSWQSVLYGLLFLMSIHGVLIFGMIKKIKAMINVIKTGSFAQTQKVIQEDQVWLNQVMVKTQKNKGGIQNDE